MWLTNPDAMYYHNSHLIQFDSIRNILLCQLSVHNFVQRLAQLNIFVLHCAVIFEFQ